MYDYPQIVLREVPNEISLALSIFGCNLKCKGCHSKETWDKNNGKELSYNELDNLIKKHKYITCVLLYGGEWQMEDLYNICLKIKQYNIKICLYTGLNIDNPILQKIINILDYIKVGSYKEELGALESKTTNQRFFELKEGKIVKEHFFY